MRTKLHNKHPVSISVAVAVNLIALFSFPWVVRGQVFVYDELDVEGEPFAVVGFYEISGEGHMQGSGGLCDKLAANIAVAEATKTSRYINHGFTSSKTFWSFPGGENAYWWQANPQYTIALTNQTFTTSGYTQADFWMKVNHNWPGNSVAMMLTKELKIGDVTEFSIELEPSWLPCEEGSSSGTYNGYYYVDSGITLVRQLKEVPPSCAISDAQFGNPIDAISGVKAEVKQEFYIATPGLPLEFRRMYYSDTGMTNVNWVHNFNWLLYDATSEFDGTTNTWKVLRVGADKYWFKDVGSGVYTSPVGTSYGLTIETNGSQVVTLDGGMSASFDTNGVLQVIEEPFGNELSMTYTNSFPSNLLTRVEHSNGLGIDFQYNTNALLERVDLPSTNLYLTYGYDTNSYLIQASRILPDETEVDGYSYVDTTVGGGMEYHTNAAGYVSEFSFETNGVGQYTSRGLSTWVGTNKFLETYVEYTSDETHLRTVKETRNGTDYVTEIVYHPIFDKLEAIYGPEVSTTGTMARSKETRFGFDTYGNRTSVTKYDWDVSEWAKTAMAFDSDHQVTNLAYGYMYEPTNTWAYTWHDDYHTITSITDPEDRTVEFDYTNGLISASRLVVDTNTSYETKYTYTTNGLLASVTNANGNSVSYDYDNYGYLEEIDPQAGPTITLSNNVLGHLVKIELPGWIESGSSPPSGDPDPRAIELEPDGLGQVRKITYPDDFEETFTYDAVGNLVTNVDRAGRTTTYTYEPLGRLSSSTRYLVGDSSTQDVTIAFGYDQQFNTLEIADPLDREVEAYQLDDLGRAVSVTNVDDQVLSIDYGVADYVNSITRFDQSEVLFLYGDNGLLGSAIYDDETLGYDYYRNDLLKAATNSSASITNIYNSVNRLTNVVTDVDALTSGVVNVSYTYFPAGQVSNVTSQAGTVTYDYDAAERVTNIVDSVAGTFGYSYNTNNGLVKDIEYPNDVECALGYDVMDRLTDITWTGPSGTLHSLSYEYDNAGMIANRVEESLAGTRNSAFTYDSLDRLTGETYSDGSGTAFDEVTYGYDLAGNRTNKTHNGVTVSFDLGAGNRMTNWTAQVSTNAEAVLNVAGYSTEDIGTNPLYGEWTVNSEDVEISGSNFWATTVFSDLSQSTQSVIAVIGDEAGNVGRDTNDWTLTIITNAAYTFDDAGSVTEIAYNSNLLVRTLGWDDQYQLLAVSNGTSEVESYTYDPFGRRLTTKTGTNTITHLFDGIHCIADVDSSGSLVRSYTYGPGIDNPLAMTTYSSGTNTYYYLTDYLGSALALTDEDGQLVESYQYDAFGRIKVFDSSHEEIPESAFGNRITFQGREYSWATGLYYFRARWYEPVTGRWLSKDPIGISGGLNQYMAFLGNGVMGVDPDGLSGDLTIKAIADGSQTYGYTTGRHAWIEFDKDHDPDPGGGGSFTAGTFGNDSGRQGRKGLNRNTERQPIYRDNVTDSRTMHINDAQEKALRDYLRRRWREGEAAWGPKNNCASFASETWRITTGEFLDPRVGRKFPSPQALGESIRKKNAEDKQEAEE